MKALRPKPTLTTYRDANHAQLEGCVGHWHFLAGGGNTVYNLAPTASADMTFGGATVPTWVTGPFGGPAMNFVSNSYIQATNGSQFDFSTLDQITAMAWANPTTTTNDQTIVAAWEAANSTKQWALQNNRAVVSNGSGTNGIANKATANVTGWHHYAFTYDKVTVRFYTDGIPDGTGASTIELNYDGTTPIKIGLLQVSTTQPFTGDIDDVRVYNRVLSQAEIMSVVESPFLAYVPIEDVDFVEPVAVTGHPNFYTQAY